MACCNGLRFFLLSKTDLEDDTLVELQKAFPSSYAEQLSGHLKNIKTLWDLSNKRIQVSFAFSFKKKMKRKLEYSSWSTRFFYKKIIILPEPQFS